LKIGILGGGFALYGWAKCILEKKIHTINTLLKYKKVINNRIDLFKYQNNIVYYKKLKDVILNSKTVIIAKRPKDQSIIVNKIIRTKKINIILEKPISNNPLNSIKLLKNIYNSRINFLIGMTIAQTNWAKKIKYLIKKKRIREINIKWYFLAHHYKNRLYNWKRYVDQGGGALNFYLIHFIYIFSFIPNLLVKFASLIKNNEDVQSKFVLVNKDITINIDCNTGYKKKNFFCIIIKYNKIRKQEKIILKEPFAEKSKKNKINSRDDYINLILQKLFKKKWDRQYDAMKHLYLWKKIYDKMMVSSCKKKL
jgi:hypothetical protein